MLSIPMVPDIHIHINIYRRYAATSHMGFDDVRGCGMVCMCVCCVQSRLSAAFSHGQGTWRMIRWIYPSLCDMLAEQGPRTLFPEMHACGCMDWLGCMNECADCRKSTFWEVC